MTAQTGARIDQADSRRNSLGSEAGVELSPTLPCTGAERFQSLTFVGVWALFSSSQLPALLNLDWCVRNKKSHSCLH